MKTALTRLLASAKFWTTIIGILATSAAGLLAKYGLELDAEATTKIAGYVAGFFSVLLATQGAADFGKHAANNNSKAKEVPPSPPPVPPLEATEPTVVTPSIPSTTLRTQLALALMVIALASCGPTNRIGNIASGVVDCLTPETKALTDEFKPVVRDLIKNAIGNDGKVDWVPVRAGVKSFRASVGGCVLSSVISEVLNPRPVDPNAPAASPLTIDPADVSAGFETLRKDLYGGAKFKLEAGLL